MSSGGSQNSLRKTLGALKDTTAVSLAKINSDYKELDIAIVKATNHHERPAKERHIRAVFAAISATRPRADVAYCIHALARRLSKTHNWAVALKTLIIIHRALREVDPTFQELIINYGRNRSRVLNLTHFKDDSSPNAWEYSGWVRAYALFLEERMECFRVLKYDIQDYRLVRTKELDTPDLLEQLPAFQNLLYRVLGCQPQGAASRNFIIQLALSMVASESIKIYYAISDGAVNLVDKFFEMQRLDALKALDIYRRAGLQAERLSKFYEICKSLDLGRGERYIKIEQPPASFIQTMEEYVRDAPQSSTTRRDMANGRIDAVLTIEYKNSSEEGEEPESEEPEASVSETASDLLGLHEPSLAASEFEQKNAMALAILPLGETQKAGPTGPNLANGITGWELALVATPNPNESAATPSKLAGGMDKFTLDSLYDDAIRRSNPNASYNPWEQKVVMGSPDPFYASNAVAAPTTVQLATAYNNNNNNQQHAAFMPHQQTAVDLFAKNPYGATGQPFGQSLPVRACNPYSGLI